jgi:hypothetical protein
MKKFRGKILTGKVVSVHMGNNEDLSKDTQGLLTAEIGGFAGDKHHGFTRKAWKVDWQLAGTVRRNERQWSGVSVEELAHIADRLALTEPLAPDTLGANLCVEGIPEFSLLPKGTKLLFPSGAVLLVEEYNPPCAEMGARLVAKHVTRSGESLTAAAWLRPAAGRRGLVGIVDVPGVIKAGDEVEFQVYEEPAIRLL